MAQEEIEVYRSSTKKRSLLQLGREVKRAIKYIEIETGIILFPQKKREDIRHELGHHIPLIDHDVQISASIEDEDDTVTYSLNLTHHNVSPLEQLESAAMPRKDKRMKHKLSDTDHENIRGALARLKG